MQTTKYAGRTDISSTCFLTKPDGRININKSEKQCYIFTWCLKSNYDALVSDDGDNDDDDESLCLRGSAEEELHTKKLITTHVFWFSELKQRVW